MQQTTGVFPALTTNRLLLREIERQDTTTLHQYWTDKQVTKYFTLEPFKNIKETQDMMKLLKDLYYIHQGFRWVITSLGNGDIYGTCGFHNINPEHYRAEVGYELGKEYWGQGIMAEALKAILTFGFTVQQYHRIEAFVNFGNDKSVRILEKMGFNQDGLLRNYEFARGKFVDQYCYSLLRNEYIK